MSDPMRWRDAGAGPEGARELLRMARPARRMTAPQRARAVARVSRHARIPLAASLALIWAKGIAAAAGIGVAGYVLATEIAPRLDIALDAAHVEVSARPPSPNATRAPSHVPIPATDAAREALLATPIVPSAGYAPPRPDSAKPEAVTARIAPSASIAPMDPLAREASLLESARVTLTSDPARSLELLNQHVREFPRAKLALERELLAVEALHRMGRNAEARARGASLVAADPSGPYSARVFALLGD